MESGATRAAARRRCAGDHGVPMLIAGMVVPGDFVNLRPQRARDVGGAIMPPGMIMDRSTRRPKRCATWRRSIRARVSYVAPA